MGYGSVFPNGADNSATGARLVPVGVMCGHEKRRDLSLQYTTYHRLPFHAATPPGSAHFALGNVAGVAGLKACTLLLHAIRLVSLGLASSLGALLTEADQLGLVAFFSENDVTFCWMTWGSLWLVVSA